MLIDSFHSGRVGDAIVLLNLTTDLAIAGRVRGINSDVIHLENAGTFTPGSGGDLVAELGSGKIEGYRHLGELLVPRANWIVLPYRAHALPSEELANPTAA